mmetsp:Transcript_29357/g.77105  ORF Transcript_29357/g.77105 Transcript_29357/m.77105 type:complete len:205 (-) Transcript_29357:440-1054(-)
MDSKEPVNLGKIVGIIHVLAPYFILAKEKIIMFREIIRPFDYWAPALFGAFLVFFGGRFLTTIAAAEAIRLVGVEKLADNAVILWNNFQAGVEAALKDDVPREDRGAQSWTKDKAVRVLRIFLKTLDPKEVQKALEGLYQVVLSVVATLRLRFAAAVTLGCAVGDIFRKAAELVARPRLEEALAPDYHKWIDTLIECATPPALA